MRVLAIDPGIRRENPMGVVIFDIENGNPILVEHALLKPSKGSEEDRKGWLALQINVLITEFSPDLVVYEAAHMQRNSQVFRVLAELGGLCFAVAAIHELPVISVQPTEAKKALGNAKADDAQIRALAKATSGVELPDHCAIALGIGLAGYQIYAQQQLSKARRRPGGECVRGGVSSTVSA